jgi:DNA polymerase III epsilon subunit-like protein
MLADRPLKDLPIAVIDTETTGLDTTTARIVDVAVVHATLGAEDDAKVAFSSLVNPGQPIPPDSTRITGIDDAMVVDAPTWSQVADKVLAACEGRLIVAYNAPYDFKVIRAELARMVDDRVAHRLIEWDASFPWLDLLVVRKATKTRGRPGRLSEIAAEYAIELEAHGATGDALTTALLAYPLMRRAWLFGAFRGSMGAQPYDDQDDDDEPPKVDTVAKLIAWQKGAALYQERDFASYRQRQGDAAPPSCPWHELLGVAPPTWSAPVRTTPCASCGRGIIWRITKAGKRIPLDLEELTVVLYDVLVTDPEVIRAPTELVYVDGEVKKGWKLDASVRTDLQRVTGRRSHFSTCPQAAQHRRAAS